MLKINSNFGNRRYGKEETCHQENRITAKMHLESFLKDFETSTKEGANSLSSSIKDFEASAKSGADNASELVRINKEFADNANQLNQQMQSLASNLESLNDVYGGVLSAMNKK